MKKGINALIKDREKRKECERNKEGNETGNQLMF